MRDHASLVCNLDHEDVGLLELIDGFLDVLEIFGFDRVRYVSIVMFFRSDRYRLQEIDDAVESGRVGIGRP
jgi:hypothetical protein